MKKTHALLSFLSLSLFLVACGEEKPFSSDTGFTTENETETGYKENVLVPQSKKFSPIEQEQIRQNSFYSLNQVDYSDLGKEKA